MQETGRETELCRSVFTGADEADIIRGFTACWIALINRAEAGEADVQRRSDAPAEA
ncbi:MAG: hypothetical protein IJE07_13630 [Clostridia bacterium]|nr:hypothetical protein [Clostridia bacterium]